MVWANSGWPFSGGYGLSTTSISGSGPAPFTPADLATLLAWYKSDTGITLNLGVSQWADQSGNNNTLLSSGASARPSVSAGAINGLPGIVFNGTSNFLTAAFELTQPYTVFIVFSQLSHTVDDTIFDGITFSNSLFQTGASPNLTTDPTAIQLNNQLSLSTFGLASCIFDAASSFLQINNGAQTVSDTSGLPALDGITLGADGSALLSFFSHISVAEVIVMGSAATSDERQQVRDYVESRYNIAM